MNRKLALITGATNGIGKVTAVELAKKGFNLILIGRDSGKLESLTGNIAGENPGGSYEAITADLTSMNEVRRAAESVKSRHASLDVLINNAGSVFNSYEESADGYEKTFALNHLAYFLLTGLLIDNLKKAEEGRVLVVSSEAQRNTEIKFEDVMMKNKYSMMKAYSQSKQANVQFAYHLARKLENSKITVNALHPGVVRTGIWNNARGPARLAIPLLNLFFISAEKGAETQIHLASSDEVKGVTGKYFIKKKAVKSSPASYDTLSQRKLWELSERLTGFSY